MIPPWGIYNVLEKMHNKYHIISRMWYIIEHYIQSKTNIYKFVRKGSSEKKWYLALNSEDKMQNPLVNICNISQYRFDIQVLLYC
jgi:hypothetical protein